MSQDDPAGPPPEGLRRPIEGDVLNERWGLSRRVASGVAGDVFDGLNTFTDEKVIVWVLAPELASDPDVARRVREEARRPNRGAGAARGLEMDRDATRGATYLVIASAGERNDGAGLSQAMADLPTALTVLLGVAPPAALTPGAAPDLMWLHDQRLAAARAGVAPLRSAFPWRGPATALAAPAVSAPAPTPPQAAASAPPPARRSRAGLWGGAALGGAAAVGVLVLATAQLGNQLPVSLQKAGPAVGGDTTVAAPAPGEPLQALAGSWALQGGDCERPTRLAVIDGRLIAQGAAAPITVGRIQSVDPAGAVVVREPPGDATTYRVTGDTLTVTSGRHPSLVFTRCPSAPAASNAEANVAGEAALIAMAFAGAGGAAPEAPPPARDEVDVSAFAPKRLRAGGAALVQIYLHLVEQADAAADRARAADAEAALRGQTTLGLELARGTRVDVMLDAGALDIDEPIQSLIWRGRPAACQFAVSTPADLAAGQHVLTARLLVDGVPLGRLAFTMAVDAGAAAETPELTGDDAARYTRAFLSYSSLDRPEVLKTAQTLRATGIDFFQDILSIEPGEAWRERLFAEIDRCDLFLLFWSSHAASSDWVRQEAEYALARHRGSAEASPDIRPIILEGPPIPPPPVSLASLHFNDMLRYMVVASELEAKARVDGRGGA